MSPQHIEAILIFIEVQDIPNISREAHILKSISKTLGALLLGEIYQKLENIVDMNNNQNLQELSKLLKNVYLLSCQEFLENLTVISLNLKRVKMPCAFLQLKM